MSILKRFIKDVVKYKEYVYLSSRSELKTQVSETVLGYLWWILDPFLQMLIYTLLVTFIMKKKMENFAVFAFIALLPWKWFLTSISSSTDCIKKKASVLQQVYLPKFILPLIKCLVNLVKFIFGFVVIFILLFAFKIKPTFHIIEVIPVIIVNGLFLYGVCLHVAHYGVFLTDLKNMMNHLTRLWFYVSPGIYHISQIPEKYRFLWWLNPMTTFFESYRNVIMYGKSPLYGYLLVWFVVSCVILYLGLRNSYKFDKNYTKVI